MILDDSGIDYSQREADVIRRFYTSLESLFADCVRQRNMTDDVSRLLSDYRRHPLVQTTLADLGVGGIVEDE